MKVKARQEAREARGEAWQSFIGCHNGGKLLFSSVALCQTLIDRPLLLLYLLTATPA